MGGWGGWAQVRGGWRERYRELRSAVWISVARPESMAACLLLVEGLGRLLKNLGAVGPRRAWLNASDGRTVGRRIVELRKIRPNRIVAIHPYWRRDPPVRFWPFDTVQTK